MQVVSAAHRRQALPAFRSRVESAGQRVDSKHAHATRLLQLVVVRRVLTSNDRIKLWIHGRGLLPTAFFLVPP